MMDIVVNVSRPILRINVIVRSSIEPTNLHNDNKLFENEKLGDKSKERFYDQSNDILGYDLLNRYDHPLDVEDQQVDVEDLEYFEEVYGDKELRSLLNHYLFDGNNSYMDQTFSTKSELKCLFVEAAVRKSFGFYTLKSCTKYLKVKCVCVCMLRA